MTTRASSVELTRPPRITTASGEYRLDFSRTSGMRPPIAVSVVSKMGTKRASPARLIASSSVAPSSRSWFVKSTSRIEFFTSMPMSATKPTFAVKESVSPLMSRATRPPMTPSGITDATISVLLKVRNSSTRIAITPNAATRIAVPRPPKLS